MSTHQHRRSNNQNSRGQGSLRGLTARPTLPSMVDAAARKYTWDVTPGQVGELVARIFDPDRDVILVLVSPSSDTGEPRIDVDQLASLLPAGTEIARLTSMATSSRLTDLVDSAFRCFGGGVRVILPGASRNDTWRRHRLFTIYPDDDPQAACREIAAFATDHDGARGWTTVPTVHTMPVLRADQTSALKQLRSSLTSIPKPGPPRPAPATPVQEATTADQSPVDSAPQSQQTPADGITLDDVRVLLQDHSAGLVAAVQRAVTDDLLEILSAWQDGTSRESSRADAAEEELADLRRRYAELAEQVAGSPVVFDDPEQQFRWEVEQEWLVSTRESERTPLRTYSLGPDFLDGLAAQIVPRRKTIQVVVDVLTSAVWKRRPCHQLATSARGGTQIVRDDGAAAWRAYVKIESPGAPRLQWWELPDQSVELWHVGHHDAGF